ncbi:hypothetical protein N8A98_22305 [Devosia neptuniae]|uniref:Uncharacterized protein n=1 Tax=Devosia neptuniae TaxID=191302 RepID=A0ABY6CFC9_9HYPH|nr:hypothetical protein [Devosia neptuniae]UXN69906.1 hypothetical protein N8A98_22305 [Devosia neptuniae]
MATLNPFQWGEGGEALSPEQVKRRRAVADAIRMKQGFVPGNGLDLLGGLAREVVANHKGNQADEAEAEGVKGRKAIISALAANPNAGMGEIAGALGNEWVASDPGSTAIVNALMSQRQQEAAWARQEAQQQAQWSREDERFGMQREWQVADREAETAQAAADRKANFKHDYGLIEAKAATDSGQQYINVGNGMVFDTEAKDFVSPTGDGALPAVDFGDTTAIRKEIQSLPSYKNYAQALPIYSSMVDTAGTDTKASDLNLVYGLGKIMDPGSVVREGEMVMVSNTSSLPDWLQGWIASVNGGAKLTPETRKAILDEAYSRISGYDGMFKQDMQQYQGIADRYRINPDDIIPQFSPYEQWSPPDLADPAVVPGQSTVAPSDIDALLEKYN